MLAYLVRLESESTAHRLRVMEITHKFLPSHQPRDPHKKHTHVQAGRQAGRQTTPALLMRTSTPRPSSTSVIAATAAPIESVLEISRAIGFGIDAAAK